MANFKPAKIERQNAEPLSNALALFVARNHLGSGLLRHAVFNAWDKASGAGRLSANKFLKDGVLYVTLTSSVVRSTLNIQLDDILVRLNRILDEDESLRSLGISDRVNAIKLK